MVLSGDVITVSPTSNSQSLTYQMLITHSTTFEDAPISFDTVTIIIGNCVITHIDPPTSPGDQTYTIHALNDINLDLSSPGFVQQPACGYVLNEVISWSFNPSPSPPLITNVNTPYTLKISSSTNSHANVFTATLANAVTYVS